MQQVFEVDMSSVMDYANKLSTLHCSAFPNAVRSTLNGAAFDVKKRSLPLTAKHEFVNRTPNFFKANSTVDQARGWNVATMEAAVGMFENKLQDKSNNYAVQNLEQQEHGGRIDKKAFIPMRTARTGKSDKENVRKGNRLSQINNLVNAKDSTAKTENQRFIESVFHAGIGGFVLSEKGIVFRVDKITRKKGGQPKFKLTPLYSYNKGRSVNVKATHFMEKAAKRSAKLMPRLFKEAAEFQFKKHLG